ncbi:MAG TPA: AraC family transcriptional regulator [Actinophytocola sp.]|nr:AraC family transcriptional regulator [Actinophytocola sp.]
MATRSLLDPVEDAARDDFNASHLPWRIDVDGPRSAVTSRVRMGGSWFVDCRVGRMTGRRGVRDIRETPGDFIAVLLVDRGTEIFTQNDVETVVTAGTAALWDSVRPAACFSAATLVKRTMFVPRDVLAPKIKDVGSTMTRTLPDSADLRLLSSWLQVAHRHADDAEAAAAAGMLAVDLVHAAVARARGESAESGDVLLLRVKSYLGEHLHDPDLRLDDVARACAISLRYLHQLFQGTGETAAEHLRRRRLERAHRLLVTTGLPVTQVAYTCGFASPSAFSRAFRANFRITPSESREPLRG